MKRAHKPSFIRQLISYLVAATVFLLVFEIIFQITSLIKTGALMPLDKAHISCTVFTFFFLIIAGSMMVGIGHKLLSAMRLSFQKVVTGHAFAYAAGYMVFLALGIACAIYTKPELAEIMASAWIVFVFSALIMFIVALLAGAAFGRVYESA